MASGRRSPRVPTGPLEQLSSTVVDLTAAVEALGRTDRQPKAARTKATAPPGGPRRVRAPRRRRRGRQAPAAAPDDALFDVSRCDFATLVKKLDEVVGDS